MIYSDPDGRYIRQWVPELRDAPAEFLLSPPAGGLFRPPGGYPLPMVDHHTERDETLRRFKKHLEPQA